MEKLRPELVIDSWSRILTPYVRETLSELNAIVRNQFPKSRAMNGQEFNKVHDNESPLLWPNIQKRSNTDLQIYWCLQYTYQQAHFVSQTLNQPTLRGLWLMTSSGFSVLGDDSIRYLQLIHTGAWTCLR